jgi:hypothetical protein
MKIILTNKATNVIVDIVDSVITTTNGITIAKDLSTYTYAAIVASQLNQINVDSVPSGVVPQKYKYVDGNFVENPNYIEHKV